MVGELEYMAARANARQSLRFQLARDLAMAAVGARCFGAPSTIKHLAQDSVTLADALLAALAQPQEGGE
jgi:hypothetical protein